jgi:Icc-related predicted phosphoesterase
LRVAALYDVHANIPALDAVLDEVRRVQVDLIVFGGDVIPGPMVRETLSCVLHLDTPAQFIHGNGELAALAQIEAPDPSAVTYWGTTGGAALPEPFRDVIRWTARQVKPDYTRVLASWPRTISVEIPGLGHVLFCHATPHSETDAFTRLTPEDVLLPVFEGLGAALVVCGHTHMQFDRTIGTTRVVNAGSVGMPFGRTGADWLLLGPGVELRNTSYDLADAAERIRATDYPQADDLATSLRHPPSEQQILEQFTRISF